MQMKLPISRSLWRWFWGGGRGHSRGVLHFLILLTIVGLLGFIGNASAADAGKRLGKKAVSSLQNMINSTLPGGRIHLKAGTYYTDSLYIDKPITIEGDGGGTILKMVGKSGFLVNIVRGSVRNEEGHNYGVSLRNLRLDGNNRSSAVGAISISHLDHSTFENLFIEDFNGNAIYVRESFRESVIRNVHVRYCGGQRHAVIDIGHHRKSDPTNNIYLSDIFLVYSFGTDLYIGNTDGTNRAVRKIFVDRLFIHGPLPQIQGRKYVWKKGELASTRIRIDHAFDVKISMATINVAGVGSPAVLLQSNAQSVKPKGLKGHKAPYLVTLDNLTIGARYQLLHRGGKVDMNRGGGITVLSGERVVIDNCAFYGHLKPPIYVAPDAEVYIAPSLRVDNKKIVF